MAASVRGLPCGEDTAADFYKRRGFGRVQRSRDSYSRWPRSSRSELADLVERRQVICDVLPLGPGYLDEGIQTMDIVESQVSRSHVAHEEAPQHERNRKQPRG